MGQIDSTNKNQIDKTTSNTFMKINKDKIGFFSILRLDLILVLIFFSIPMVGYLNYISGGVKTSLLVFIFWFIVIILKKKFLNAFIIGLRNRKKIFFYIFLFISIILFNYLFVRSTNKAFNYSFHFIYYFLILIMDTYYSYRDKESKFIILSGIILVLGIQAIVSIPYLLSNSFLMIRELSSGQLSRGQELEAIRNGVGNNGLYSSLGAISLLALSSLNKYSFLLKILLMLSIFSIIVTIFMSTFFASIMLFIIGCVIFIFRNFKSILRLKQLMLISFLSFALFYFYDNYISDTRFLDPIFKKIEVFSEGNTTSRNELALVSWNTFTENPFFGIGIPENRSYDIIGGHSSWIDFFAYFGLIGFLPLLLFYHRLIFKNLKFLFQNNNLVNTACLSGIVIFFLSNFISPMFVVFSMYSFLIFFYTSPLDTVSRKNNKEIE